MLPIAIFNALASSYFTASDWFSVCIMFLVMAVTFWLGTLIGKWSKHPFRKYTPYLVSVYEGSMLAYPLYISIVGEEYLSKIAVSDVAGLLFGFGIYMVSLQQMELNKEVRFQSSIRAMTKTPQFIATLCGLVVGNFGIFDLLSKNVLLIEIYQSIQLNLTKSITPLILLIVGYGININSGSLKLCLQIVANRIMVQVPICLFALFIFSSILHVDRQTLTAIIILMSAPTTFSAQAFIQSKTGGDFFATANTMYLLVTFLVYALVLYYY